MFASFTQVLSRACRHQDAFLDLHRLKAVAPDTPGLLDMLRAAATGCLEQHSNGDTRVTIVMPCALLTLVLMSAWALVSRRSDFVRLSALP